MATVPAIHLLNAATKQELKLIKENGVYNVGGVIKIGDLYRDPVDLHVSILVVKRDLAIESLDDAASLPANGTGR